MTAVSEDVTADLNRRIAELEERLAAALTERDAAIERQTANALVNFRLQSELRAATERQHASAEILRAISESSGEAERSLTQIAETTARLFGAPSVTIRIAEGDEWIKTIRVGASSQASGAQPGSQSAARGANLPATVYQENRQIHIPDLDNLDPSMANWPLAATRAAGARTVSGTPLRRKDGAIGALIVYRDRLAPFTMEELALQQSFADQAVIAIENARLFDETQEALERQTATADILKVIASSPSEVQPVFEAIAERSNRLLGGLSTAVYSLVDDMQHLMAFTPTNPAADEALKSMFPRPASAVFWGEAIRKGEIFRILDAELATLPSMRELARLRGWRSALLVPLMRDHKAIGHISVTRAEPGPFADHHVELLKTFADQAVIGIENARLFNETQEALQRQTATADILKVIASSPSDVQPVFEAVVRTAQRLLRRELAFILRCDATHFWAVANAGLEGPVPVRNPAPVAIDPATNFPSRAIVSKENLVVADWSSTDLPEQERHIREIYGLNSALYLPLLRGGECIGILGVGDLKPGTFSETEIALAESFRDQAVIAIENTRLFNETKEALERQTATSDILRVIASSPSDTRPVFEAIVASAAKLFAPTTATITTLKEGKLHWEALATLRSDFDFSGASAVYPLPFDPDRSPSARAILERRIIEVEDTHAPDTPEYTRRASAAGGFRSAIFVPLLHRDKGIGSIILAHPQPGFKFSEKQLTLVQTFADQAVIAIENARLFNETKEALERQTATADILKVIASSPSDVKPVFEAIATRAKSLLGGFSSTVYRFIDGQAHLEAFTPTTPEADEILRSTFPLPVERFAPFEIAQSGELTQVADTENLTGEVLDIARARGFRSMLFAPLVNKGAAIGNIVVTRSSTGTFADHHAQLLKTFADQAVIAIENTRLFNEVQARTRDLEESLQQQTATTEILASISGSITDPGPVFEAVLDNLLRLFGTRFAAVFLVRDGLLHAAGLKGAPGFEKLAAHYPVPLDDRSLTGKAILTGRILQYAPIMDNPDVPAGSQDLARNFGYDAIMAVPMLRQGKAIGVLCTAHSDPVAFTEKQIELASGFADQAVIAIENTRLFNEVQARTRDLEESLQQQTATADVLKVISRSTFDLQTVLETLIKSAVELSGGNRGSIFLREGDVFPLKAASSTTPEFLQYWAANPPRAGRGSATSRVIASGKVEIIPDVLEDPEMEMPPGALVRIRGTLGVPMLRDDKVEGVLVLTRPEPGPFTKSQIDLVQTFADQAVIAVENVRLFDEAQARTRELTEALQQQTAVGDVLKTISRSTFDLQPVLDTLVETAAHLCDADMAFIMRRDGEVYRAGAAVGFSDAYVEFLKNHPLHVDRGTVTGRAVMERHTVQILDVATDPEYTLRESTSLADQHTALGVPLLRENEPIGVIVIARQRVAAFTQKQIELVTTFADQAVIAIENVRLFEEAQARTRELAKSLDDLRTAQDRLIQTEKLASLGQLTAGIAHEIKNPLNFVNNFAALSAELTDELKDALKPAVLDETIRAEVDEVTGLLKDNLAKVVQHGKRADSIVKNMLLHSREGSGDHRPADINALVEESLNLAYHGARAEKPQFNVTLKRDFDPDAGTIEVFPQEITRVLLNLISNGFYAVSKRKAEDSDAAFEPEVSATTKGRSDHVEIRIRDNGTGIPPDVKEKMFNPFFTTKPAGEGTGLGLSMSHDIIVKQHGGTIDVDTLPGAFTEFRIVLPRTSQFSDKTRGQT